MIYILKRDNEETLNYNDEVANENYFKETMLSGLVIVMVMCIISIILSCITLNKIDALSTIGTVPETTISSIVESTTAPVTVETIMPETEKTIHTEETKTPTTPTAPVSTKAPTKPTSTNPNVNPEELELLACVIYQEAGGNASCDDCRRYVADIVLNRMEHEEFPDTMEEVLTQEGQYGNFHYTGVKWPARAKYDTEKDAVERAYRIAEEVLSGNHSKLYGNGYIWQAGFVQGASGFRCCGHWYGK